MSEKKPQVFPKQEQIDARKAENEKIISFEAEKAQVTDEIYSSVKVNQNLQDQNYDYLKQNDALEMMRQRAKNELEIRNSGGVVQYSELAEKKERKKVIQQTSEEISRTRTEEQIELRDEQIRKNQEMIENYNKRFDESSIRNNNYVNPNEKNVTSMQNNYTPNQNPPAPPSTPIVINDYAYGKNPSSVDPYIFELSQPNYNAPFDVIPLPSQGKLYRNKKANIRLGYMTTADENILTSPTYWLVENS